MDEAVVRRSASMSKLLFGGVALAIGAALGAYAMVDLVGARVYAAQSVNEARSIADMAENVGTWASKYKGVWIKDAKTSEPAIDRGSFIDTQRYTLAHDAGPDAGVFDTYHSKNPALVQRELSDVSLQSNSRGKFRLTSDKYMNPTNAPDGFDIKAMRALDQGGRHEYYEIAGGEMRYARRVEAKESCLSCHGKPETAPAAIARLYPGPQGYGYVKGGLAGIISVRLPYAYDRRIVLDELL